MPKISSLSPLPLRRALPVPQTTEQLVDVLLPAWMRLALGTDAAGRVWTCVWKQSTGSTGAWRAPGTPSGPARKGSPPAQGGILILGKAEAAALVVSVTMQLKFQQSIFEFFQVPQLQFIDSVVVFSVASQRQGSQCKLYRRPEIPRTCPLVCKRQDLVRQCRKLWFRSCIPLTRRSMSLLLQFIDKVWTSM